MSEQNSSESFSKLSIESYVANLSSDSPSPGGGSAAALTGALGVSLAEMVCRINSKKIKSNPDHKESLERAETLLNYKNNLLDLVTLDAEAFTEISKHWKDKTENLQKALKNGAEVPYSIICNANSAIDIAVNEIPSTSKHLISDLSECGILLRATLHSAILNVKINLFSIDDKDFVRTKEEEIQKITINIEQKAKILEESFK